MSAAAESELRIHKLNSRIKNEAGAVEHRIVNLSRFFAKTRRAEVCFHRLFVNHICSQHFIFSNQRL